MRRWLASAVRALLVGACALCAGDGCGAVAAPPPLPEPFNVCPAYPCTAYATGGVAEAALAPTCQEGICQSNDPPFDYTLLVSLPESSSYAPGLTLPILFTAQEPACTPGSAAQLIDEGCLGACGSSPGDANANALCVQIPEVLEPEGALVIENGVVCSANAEAYVNNGGATSSVPVHVQYRPLWPPLPGAATYVEASSVGLPLSPIEATLGFDPRFAPGPGGTLPTEWRAPIGPGMYENDIVPDNGAFPPLTLILPAANTTFESQQLNVDSAGVSTGGAVPAARLRVVRTDGALAGFSAYLRDPTTHRRVSSIATYPETAPPVVASRFCPTSSNACAPGFWCTPDPDGGLDQDPLLLTLGEPAAPQGLEVVVAPPDGSPIPYLADQIILSSLGSETLPPLPAPVTVSGTIVGPDPSVPVAASLVIDSTPGTPEGGGITLAPAADTRIQPFLYYSTSVQTDVGGNYSVTLPPGTYDVFITPVLGSNLGATSVTLEVAPALALQPPVAAGKNLVLSALGTMAGKATVADGRPLVGATVQAWPAASLAASLTRTVSDPRRWPRAGTTTTDASGAFAMALDPGTYDVVVQPADGTGLPWVVLSEQSVVASKTTNVRFGAPVTVPAPWVQELVLHAPTDDSPIVQAIVRAYAPASGSTNPTPGAPAPLIEIGSWVTDANGRVTMLLAPPK